MAGRTGSSSSTRHTHTRTSSRGTGRSCKRGGALSFELVPGALREIAAEAQDNPAAPHLLIIDEINRGNLAKIFGELYFLLEYRDAGIRLQYSRR